MDIHETISYAAVQHAPLEGKESKDSSKCCLVSLVSRIWACIKTLLNRIFCCLCCRKAKKIEPRVFSGGNSSSAGIGQPLPGPLPPLNPAHTPPIRDSRVEKIAPPQEDPAVQLLEDYLKANNIEKAISVARTTSLEEFRQDFDKITNHCLATGNYNGAKRTIGQWSLSDPTGYLSSEWAENKYYERLIDGLLQEEHNGISRAQVLVYSLMVPSYPGHDVCVEKVILAWLKSSKNPETRKTSLNSAERLTNQIRDEKLRKSYQALIQEAQKNSQ